VQLLRIDVHLLVVAPEKRGHAGLAATDRDDLAARQRRGLAPAVEQDGVWVAGWGGGCRARGRGEAGWHEGTRDPWSRAGAWHLPAPSQSPSLTRAGGVEDEHGQDLGAAPARQADADVRQHHVPPLAHPRLERLGDNGEGRGIGAGAGLDQVDAGRGAGKAEAEVRRRRSWMEPAVRQAARLQRKKKNGAPRPFPLRPYPTSRSRYCVTSMSVSWGSDVRARSALGGAERREGGQGWAGQRGRGGRARQGARAAGPPLRKGRAAGPRATHRRGREASLTPCSPRRSGGSCQRGGSARAR
jgi:hypothetical protein